MGYLYYGHYAQYYEIGRAEMIRSLGLSYRAMEEEHGVLMPVMSLQCRYVRPALYDELITIRSTLRHLPQKTITFHMELFNEKGKLVNGGSVKLCFVDAKTNKSIDTPPYLLEKLKPYFEEI
jgi:acyl-CoA thioester hydrolase